MITARVSMTHAEAADKPTSANDLFRASFGYSKYQFERPWHRLSICSVF